MRRLFIFVLLFVGVVLAASPDGWKDGKEYIYKIKSRTLSSFNKNSKQFSGIVLESQLTIQPIGPNVLRAQITQSYYSPIQTHLGQGWESEIPWNQICLKNLTLSDEPFEVKTKGGLVKSLIVSKNLSTWQVNILKSIVGQLQFDIEHERNRKYIRFSDGEQPRVGYKTMEDSVTGKCEMAYNISIFPVHTLENNLETAPMLELRDDGDFIAVEKRRNYSNCDQKFNYYFEIDGRNDWELENYEIDKYLSRSSTSRMIISGNAKVYTIHSSVTSNTIIFNPDKGDDKQGMLYSKIELRLQKADDIQVPLHAPSDPELINNLMYSYNDPFEKESPLQLHQSTVHKKNKKNDEYWKDDKDNEYEFSSNSYCEEEDGDTQPEPTITGPLFPFSIGNYRHFIAVNSTKVNILESVESLAREISNEMIHYDSIQEQNILEKFTILWKFVRLMNVKEIEQVQHALYEPPPSDPTNQEKKARRNAWIVFRDAVAQAGNEAALKSITKWVKEKIIKNYESVKVIDSMAKSIRIPTPEYLNTFLEMLKLHEIEEQPVVYDNLQQSYADLLYHAVVEKRKVDIIDSMPVFEKIYEKNIDYLHSKYFPYIITQLQDGFNKNNSIKIQALITAIGRTGHPRMLSIFEPYIEGKKLATPYERFLMVISMDRLVNNYPNRARSVLYKIYNNTDDHYEIRTAAVYLLMNTNPSEEILKKMASFTHHDPSKQVSSAVKSSIEWLNRFKNDLRHAAAAAIPLLTPQIYGTQYSQGFFLKFPPEGNSGYTLEAFRIGNDDSVIPKGVFITLSSKQDKLKIKKIQVGGTVSNVQDLWETAQKQLGIKTEKNEKAKQMKYSPENIAKMLGIKGNKAELLEGFLNPGGILGTQFFSFSDRLSEHTEGKHDNLLFDLPEEFRRLEKGSSKEVSFDETNVVNNEMIISFPIETGYSFSFSLTVSSMLGLVGQLEAHIESDQDNQSLIPTSASLSAKAHFVHAMNVQKRLSFVTPFDHQEYIAGVDKRVQFHLPINGEIVYNNAKKEIRLKVRPNDEEPQFQILQIKTEPFISKHDIFSLTPVSNDRNTHVIGKDVALPQQYDINYNQQGLQFHWANFENKRVSNTKPAGKEDAEKAYPKMGLALKSMYFSDSEEDSEYQMYSVKLSPDRNMSAEIKLTYDFSINKYMQNNRSSSNEKNEKPRGKAPRLDRNMDERERIQNFLMEVSKDIYAAKAFAADVSFKLNGDFRSYANLTVAHAKSNVDEKARILLHASAKIPSSEDYFTSVGIEINSPNFRTMNYEETLKANTQHEYDSEINYGTKQNKDNPYVIKVNAVLKQLEKLKHQIAASPEAQECSVEVRKSGNSLTHSCMKTNNRAALINSGNFTISFVNDSPLKAKVMNSLKKPLESKGKSQNDTLEFSYQVLPFEKILTTTLATPEGSGTEKHEIIFHILEFWNVFGFEWDNNTETNEAREDLETLATPFITCHLDKSQIKTFDNLRYSINLGQCWHVVVTSFPKNDYFRQGDHKEIPEDKHVTVMARDNKYRYKELKITVGDKVVELLSHGYQNITAVVDGEIINLTHKYGWQENKTGEIGLQIFKLPDKSVKVISEKYEVKIVYDGIRAIIMAGDKYRASVRGLCGDNNGEPGNDLKTPKGCLLQNPEEFIASYALIDDEQCQASVRHNAEKANQFECTKDDAHPKDVISDKDAGRKNNTSNNTDGITDDSSLEENCIKRYRYKNKENKDDKKFYFIKPPVVSTTPKPDCTMLLRTMVSKYKSEICFSMEPVYMCPSGCHSTGETNEKIAFHCVLRSSFSESVAQTAEEGAKLGFTREKLSQFESHMIPTGCEA